MKDSHDFDPMGADIYRTPKQIAFDTLIERMKAGKVSFTYKKKDGSVREANGTINPELIPDAQKSTEKKEYTGTQNYYDFDAQDWRCFIIDNFIGISE